jgi:pimeloyl-ACP methyl ester carboxylesterase
MEQAHMATVLPLPSGGALHVEQQEAARHRVPLLFLHGVGGGAWSWAPQRLALQHSHPCFTHEGRGHGAASPVQDAGLADYFADAAEALAHVRKATGQDVLVVAHSMGGLLALALACRPQSGVRGLFLVDPVYADRGDPPVRFPAPLLWLIHAFVSMVARSFRTDGWLGRAMAWPFFKWAFHDRHARDEAWTSQRKQVPLEYPRMLHESFDGVTGFPFQPFADVVNVPVLLVEALSRPGARSRFSSEVERLKARLGEDAVHHGLVGGHYLQLDCPQQLTELLVDWIADIVRGKDAPA